MIVWGERIGREGDGAVAALLDLAAALDLAGKDGSGLLEVPDARQRPRPARGRLPPRRRPGPDRPQILRDANEGHRRRPRRSAPALESGELKSLILFGVDPLRDFPDTDGLEATRSAPPTTSSPSRSSRPRPTAIADVVFPLETHAEKDGTVTHPDGRLQRVRPSAARPGDIRPNWGVLAELSRDARPRHRHLIAALGLRGSRPTRSPSTPASPTRRSAAAASAGRTAPRRRAPCPSRRGAAAIGAASATSDESSGESAPRLRPIRTAPARHLPRPLGRADHRAEPAAEVPGAAAARRAVASPTPSASGCRSATRSRSLRTARSVTRQGRRSRSGCAPAPCFLIEGIARRQRQRAAQRRPGRRSTIEKVGGVISARRHAASSRRPGSWSSSRWSSSPSIFGIVPVMTVRRAQADRPLPAPLRPQPGRPLRPPAAARRRRQAAQQGGLPPRQRGRRCSTRSGRCCRSSPASWRWRSSPSATSRTASASTGSTSRSASSTSSPSARSPSTACCSAAGPRARSTASSARCAAPRS